MSKDKSQFTPKQVETDSKSVLEDICRKGARRCLAAALEAEVDNSPIPQNKANDELNIKEKIINATDQILAITK